MRWQIVEIQEFLRQDQQLHFLFVEGDNDLALWRHLMPDADRGNAAIYKIGSVNVTAATGGEKGRSLALARITQGWAERNRVSFFVDDDGDRFLGNSTAPNVTETDGRDIESYALCDEILTWICRGAGAKPEDLFSLKATIGILLRPIGLLRLADAREGWNLPFQATLIKGSVSRFFTRRRGRPDTLRLTDLIHALLDNAYRDRNETAQILEHLSREETLQAVVPDEQVIHGKDLVATLSWHFKTRLEIADGLLRVSTAACPAALLARPNIHSVHAWVAAA